MKTRIIVLFGLFTIPLFLVGQGTPPNIVLIITDQHAGPVMTQQGYPYVETPGIDKIAAQGVSFTRSYCAYPVCTSSRKSIMTGMMPARIGSLTSYPSIGTRLQNGGYETAYFGKWHVGSTDMDEVSDWHGFETYIDSRNDTKIRNYSIDYLKQVHDQPFFMVTSFLNPHDCCELARIIAGMNDNYHDGPVEEQMDLEYCPPLPENFAIPVNEAEGFYGRRYQEPDDEYWRAHPNTYWTTTEWRQYMYGYDRLVEKVDEHIEAMVDEMESLGLLENTVIIYTSDHGDGHASHMWNQKKTFYEEAVNIPFIISWKGKTRAGVIDDSTLVNNGLDIYPTLLKLGCIDVPGSLHGESLIPNVLADQKGEEHFSRDYVVSEIKQKIYTGYTPGTFNGRMLVTKKYKYILFDKGVNREQLFDLENDPGELFPVTNYPDYREQLLSCRQMLKEWVVTTDDDFNVDNIIGDYKSVSTLAGIAVNEINVNGFQPGKREYSIELEYSDTVIFEVKPSNPAASIEIVYPDNIHGSDPENIAEINVLSVDSSNTEIYKVSIKMAPYVPPESLASLSDLQINGTPVTGFDPEVLNYSVETNICEGVVVSAIPSYSEATILILQPPDLQGDQQDRTALVQVISKDGSNSAGYSITINDDGSSCETGISKKGMDNLSLFPNPASDVLYIKLSNGPMHNISVYNMQGRRLNSIAGCSDIGQISLASLEHGLFILKVKSDSDIFISKFIKK